MDAAGLLTDLYGRVDEEVRGAVEGLTAAQLATAPEPGANTIGWLVWHLTRVEDSHIAELIEQQQVWATTDWAARFELSADPDDTGYGHTAEQVLGVRPDGPDALLGYYGAVRERTSAFLAGLTPDDLDRIVDRRWDPPVTLGVRLISIADDEIQHAGQAAYARGLLERR
jgi:uncharacterized damage-inducible protein DinB